MSLQGRDVHIVLDEPDELVAATHFGEVEERLVPCPHRARHEVSVGESAITRHLRFDGEDRYVALDTQLQAGLIQVTLMSSVLATVLMIALDLTTFIAAGW